MLSDIFIHFSLSDAEEIGGMFTPPRKSFLPLALV